VTEAGQGRGKTGVVIWKDEERREGGREGGKEGGKEGGREGRGSAAGREGEHAWPNRPWINLTSKARDKKEGKEGRREGGRAGIPVVTSFLV
jgi:hypothetical protein